MSSPGKGKPWGRITWYFIHTFCERINPQFFMAKKSECFALLTNVCSMIPCPTCRNHATEYLKKNPLNRIVRNKEDLKEYFYRFHNKATLNGNPGARAEDISVMDMYKKANFKRIIDAFSAEYMKKTPTRQDYTQTLYAQTILKSVLAFLKANRHQFVPEPEPAVAVPVPAVVPMPVPEPMPVAVPEPMPVAVPEPMPVPEPEPVPVPEPVPEPMVADEYDEENIIFSVTDQQ